MHVSQVGFTFDEDAVMLQGKPSITAPRKRRFFQLSNDGSTLRWAWNKYVLLYYVQVITAKLNYSGLNVFDVTTCF